MEIVQVIRFTGNDKAVVWKHPTVNFNTTTQLIVQESQEAIFFMNGQALDLFGPGRHTLATQNIPLISRYFNKATNDKSPYQCEIYFINKAEQIPLKWGTDSKVQYMEPTYNFPIAIGASGELSLRADNARKLLIKVAGTQSQIDNEYLKVFFRAFLMTKIKSYIGQIMRQNAINIFEIDEKLDQFSVELKESLGLEFDEYGVILERFYVTTIIKPDGEPQYETFKQLHFRQYADVAEAKLQQQLGIIEQETQARKVVIESEAIAKKRNLEGYTYQQERGFDVAEKVAENEGSGNFTSAGIGLGMMAGVGGAVGSAIGGVFDESVKPVSEEKPIAKRFCDNCGVQVSAEGKFCEECGYSLDEQEKACAGCGYKFERPGKFCPNCGTKREV